MKKVKKNQKEIFGIFASSIFLGILQRLVNKVVESTLNEEEVSTQSINELGVGGRGLFKGGL